MKRFCFNKWHKLLRFPYPSERRGRRRGRVRDLTLKRLLV